MPGNSRRIYVNYCKQISAAAGAPGRLLFSMLRMYKGWLYYLIVVEVSESYFG
jgi:hypothetical protein